MILVDTGPIVALLDKSDPNHAACMEASGRFTDQGVTAWPVVTEAMDLLNFSLKTQQALIEMLETSILRVLDITVSDLARIRALMQKYRDLPMDFADAALVRLAERERISRVFTLDRRDFSLYRPSRIGRFTILP